MKNKNEFLDICKYTHSVEQDECIQAFNITHIRVRSLMPSAGHKIFPFISKASLNEIDSICPVGYYGHSVQVYASWSST